ncbi:hypothetical protein LZ31DRAFT_485146, partial [Colletotrichum somersetense]
YTEFELQQALHDVVDNCTISEAARQWGILYATLYYRLYGRQSRNTAFINMQHLS